MYIFLLVPSHYELYEEDIMSIFTKKEIGDCIETTYYGIDHHFFKSNKNKTIEISKEHIYTDLIKYNIKPRTKKNDGPINIIKRKTL